VSQKNQPSKLFNFGRASLFPRFSGRIICTVLRKYQNGTRRLYRGSADLNVPSAIGIELKYGRTFGDMAENLLLAYSLRDIANWLGILTTLIFNAGKTLNVAAECMEGHPAIDRIFCSP
jgi:hypothetical protein